MAGEAILGEAAPLARSEDEALEELIRTCSRLVYRIAYSVLRSHHDAEDATQETFVRVLRSNTRLASVTDHKKWLARIAWRVAVERSKQQRRRHEIALDSPENPVEEAISPDVPGDQVVHRKEIEMLLEGLIAALPDKLRGPLVLSTIEEMSFEEVAAAVGTTEAAVRSRVFRARQILQGKLAAALQKR